MTRLVAESIYSILSEKAFLYDATIVPVIKQYETRIDVLSIIIIVLLVIGGIFGMLYWEKKKECKFYREALDANFGWWK